MKGKKLADEVKKAIQALEDAGRFRGIDNVKKACGDAYGILFVALSKYEASDE